MNVPIIGGGSLQSPDYLKLGGKAVEGSYVLGEFLPTDPRPEVQAFVTKYKAKYNEEPDLFAVHVNSPEVQDAYPTCCDGI